MTLGSEGDTFSNLKTMSCYNSYLRRLISNKKGDIINILSDILFAKSKKINI